MRTASLAVLSLALLAACSSVPRAGRLERGAAISSWAQRQLGRDYKFGGRSPEAGFDCSGLAWWTHRQAGVDIPPSSETQFKAGRQVVKDDIRPGDLVFFTTERRGPSHVGVYIGEGRFIHAPKKGREVSKDRLDDRYWGRRYLGARRYW